MVRFRGNPGAHGARPRTQPTHLFPSPRSPLAEWFLIQQAKARNPQIKLYGLPWAFPQWVSCNPGSLSNCTNNPYDRPQQTASYITSWVSGLKSVYGFDADYIGSWNERNYDETYIETLRSTLTAAGFASTKIIVADSSFSVARDVNKNPAFAAAVWGVGAHYPNMQARIGSALSHQPPDNHDQHTGATPPSPPPPTHSPAPTPRRRASSCGPRRRTRRTTTRLARAAGRASSIRTTCAAICQQASIGTCCQHI